MQTLVPFLKAIGNHKSAFNSWTKSLPAGLGSSTVEEGPCCCIAVWGPIMWESGSVSVVVVAWLSSRFFMFIIGWF